MKKLSFNLSLVFIVIGFVINATSIKADAGEVNAQGSTDDSSGYSGGSFSPDSQIKTQLAPSINGSIEFNKGQITLSPITQSRVNEVASALLNQVAINNAIGSNDGENVSSNSDGDKTVSTTNSNSNSAVISPNAAVVAILRGSGSQATSQFQNVLIEAGVKSASVATLINSMQGMISSPVGENGQLSVDINKLNIAINAYNKITMKSNTKTLNKLAANPEFMAIRNILNQFRTALND